MKSVLSHVLLLVFSLVFTTTAFAQDSSSGTVEGVVKDAQTDEPLISATVALHEAGDSTLVTGVTTGTDGTFELTSIEPGDYYLRISFVGYEPQTIDGVEIGGDEPERRDLGEILLNPDTAELDAVSISAERDYMEVGVDRTVYHTSNQPLSAGASAEDVLDNIPSLDVDLDGNISLRGSQSVSVHINGRPAPMEGEALSSFLQGLSSENIERVEVIPNPSARYEPDGSSGILNIVLDRNREIGWGGNVSSSVNTRGRYGGSASGYYGKGPWRLHLNYSLRYSERDNSGWRYRENRYLDPPTTLRQDTERMHSGLSNNVNLSLDYQFSEETTLTLTSIFSRRGSSGDRFNRYELYDSEQSLTEHYSRATDGEDTDLNMDYRLAFEHVFEPRQHQFTLEAQYEHEYEDELEQYLERVYPLDDMEADGEIDEQQRADEGQYEREFSLSADYVRPLGLSEDARLELGYQADFEWNDNAFFSESLDEEGDFQPDSDLNHDYRYSEFLHSAYGIVRSGVGDLGVQVGLRAERAGRVFHLWTTGEEYPSSYMSLFPSVHLSYELTEANNLSLSYSKRVRRPWTGQLNPFADLDDPTFIRVGNPELLPEYTHSGELSYDRLGEHYTITFSPYARYTVDEISSYEELTDEGVSIRTYENFSSRHSFGTELIGSLTLSDRLQGRASVNAYQRVTEAGDLASELSNKALGFRTRVSSTAKLFGGFNLQISQFYMSPMDVPGGRISSRARTDLALQKELFSGRGRINVRMRDIFDSTENLIQRDMERYYLEYFRDRNSRQLQVSFRYSFNGGGDEGDRGGRGGRRGPR